MATKVCAVTCSGLESVGFAFERFGLPIGTIADFVLDCIVNEHNFRSTDAKVKFMGKMGFACLACSMCCNLGLLIYHICVHENLYRNSLWGQGTLVKKFALVLFFMIAITNAESFGLFFTALHFATKCCYGQDTEGHMGDFQHSIECARLHLSRLCLWSQISEDGPEILIQLLAIVFAFKADKEIIDTQLLSIAFGALMLFGKILINILANAIKLDAPAMYLEKIVKKQGGNEAWRLGMTWPRLVLGMPLPRLLLNWSLLICSLLATVTMHYLLWEGAYYAGVGDHHLRLAVIYTCLAGGIGYLLSFGIVAWFLGGHQRQDYTWHLVARLPSAVLISALSIFSPSMVGALHSALGEAIHYHVAGWCPLLRSVVSLPLLVAADLPMLQEGSPSLLTRMDSWLHSSSSELLRGWYFDHFTVPPGLTKCILERVASYQHKHELIALHMMVVGLSLWSLCVPTQTPECSTSAPSADVGDPEAYTGLLSAGKDGGHKVCFRAKSLRREDIEKGLEEEKEAQQKIEAQGKALLDDCRRRDVLDSEIENYVNIASEALETGNEVLASFEQLTRDRSQARKELKEAMNEVDDLERALQEVLQACDLQEVDSIATKLDSLRTSKLAAMSALEGKIGEWKRKAIGFKSEHVSQYESALEKHRRLKQPKQPKQELQPKQPKQPKCGCAIL
mmetsp:Transcript_37889/g.95122  ORF Transcript_37889/g.95122 Transcript_37889/m.95122 type:complete len:679 (+) Transcript_37889:75-2111(+)